MSVQLREIDGRTTAAQESRATLRRAVRLRAQLRGRGAQKFVIDVVDLSTTGFRADTAFDVREGTIVWITLPGMSGLEAEIAWRRGDQIGARFQRALHPAVFDHIVALGA